MSTAAVRPGGRFPWILSAALLATSLACGGTSPVRPTTVGGAAPAGQPLTLMTYNIQAGVDAAGHYNLDGVVSVIARLQPDLVGLQELTRNHPAHNCDDQPAMIEDGLRRQTGRAWTAVYVEEWFTPDTSCIQAGRGSAPESEGLGFFAPEPIGGVTSIPLYNSRIGMVLHLPSAGSLPVVLTHLASRGPGNVSDRTKQIAQLLPWAGAQGVPRVLMGDFNAAPTDAELQPVFADMHEAWIDATNAGTASGVITGDTRVKGGRLDYIFYTPDARLTLESAEIVDTTALLGARSEVSDHRPLVARFRVR